ncbi:hypothetical protein [Verrucosispora sp. TAA-831]|uniref:hypothetical protein n=1 Tax=Verrucosispora sp. TAA-831 TaxID=3422227 RepID=UPI003D6DA911
MQLNVQQTDATPTEGEYDGEVITVSAWPCGHILGDVHDGSCLPYLVGVVEFDEQAAPLAGVA